MRNEILIESVGGEIRVVLLEDGHVTEAYIERPDSRRMTGDIYKGRVSNVLPGIESAFVDIGLERHAFLYVEDLTSPTAVPEDDSGAGGIVAPPSRAPRAAIESLLEVGQELIVQVARDPIAQKGARITTQAALAGRFLVYLPSVEHVGVSRRIEDEPERERLRSLVTEVIRDLGLTGGCIVRTAGEGQSEDGFRSDASDLASLWAEIERGAETQPAPALLYREPDAVARVLRDIFRSDIDRVTVDGPRVYHEAIATMGRMQEDLVARMHLHEGRTSLFRERGIQKQLNRALKPRVWLKSGGSIVINQTEALVAIDVNTGKYVGKRRLEETILKTNLEAVEEVVRQVRLRDLAGIIVIDFIDMGERESRTRVLDALQRELRRDRARSRVLQISEFGLVEITRQRTKPSLERLLCHPCPSCGGSGRLKSPRTIYFEILREARDALAFAAAAAVRVRAHPRMAAYLEGEREALSRDLGLSGAERVSVEGDGDLGSDDYEVSAT